MSLRSIRTDPATFAREILGIEIPPHMRPAPTIAIGTGRRHGKSRMLEAQIERERARLAALWLVFAIALFGCVDLPSLETGRCTSDGESSISRQINPGPDCNGDAHANECAAAGAPSAYGLEEGCKVPATFEPGQCRPRPRGLEGCIPVGRLLCCPP